MIRFLESADYERRTGGWIYNHRLLEGLRSSGCEVMQLALPAYFSTPDHAIGANLEALLSELPKDSVVLADNLYLMRVAGQLKRHGTRTVAIFHHPISEEGQGADTDGRRIELEKLALAEASFIICPSELIARRLVASNGIDASKIVVALPGMERCPPSLEYIDGDWRFLSVGAVVPRKRYEFLIEALAGLPDRRWRWTVAGNVLRYPDYVAALKETIRGHGLNNHIELLGEIDEPALESLWRGSHMFLSSSAFEGYGMAIAEALARGLPTISTQAGAVADWASDAAILVGSDNPMQMTARIAAIRDDRAAYLAAQNRSLSFGRSLPGWDNALRPAVDRIRSLAAMPK